LSSRDDVTCFGSEGKHIPFNLQDDVLLSVDDAFLDERAHLAIAHHLVTVRSKDRSGSDDRGKDRHGDGQDFFRGSSPESKRLILDGDDVGNASDRVEPESFDGEGSQH